MQREILEQIKEFADKAHGEQTRKYTPERYIVHPVRVMNIVARHTEDTAVLTAALLHDVLEDTPTTVEDIRNFLSPILEDHEVDKAVRLTIELTDVYTKINYPKLNRRQRKAKEIERLHLISAEGQTIKYADILDNAVEIVEQDTDFARVFLHEARSILRKMDKGDIHLYEKTYATVEDLLIRLKKIKAHTKK